MDLSITQFKNRKKQILDKVDASRKKSIDEPIKELIVLINSHDDYMTTSSCSGRVILFTQYSENFNMKQNFQTVYSSHNIIKPDVLAEFADPLEGDLVLKYEPFILHVQCRTMQAAKVMQTCAFQSGFRNSGIIIGKHGKITMAVRSCIVLEVPISENRHLLVSEDLLRFLSEDVNRKMEDNKLRTLRFTQTIEELMKK